MQTKIHSYPVTIKETYLDMFGHMNNAVYLTLFEEARWDLINKNGYGLPEIMASGIGPTLLEVNIVYLKELRLREEIMIETQLLSYTGKISKIKQEMLRAGEVCCKAEFTVALFNLKERKLVLPTPEWLKAIGVG